MGIQLIITNRSKFDPKANWFFNPDSDYTRFTQWPDGITVEVPLTSDQEQRIRQVYDAFLIANNLLLSAKTVFESNKNRDTCKSLDAAARECTKAEQNVEWTAHKIACQILRGK